MFKKLKRILIIDDEEDMLEAAKKILEAEGCIVETAKNGAKALDVLKQSKFDLILLDIIMPTLSGYDLLRLLREKLDSKIAYLTIVPKKEVELAGVDGFIQKPYSPKTLVTKV